MNNNTDKQANSIKIKRLVLQLQRATSTFFVYIFSAVEKQSTATVKNPPSAFINR